MKIVLDIEETKKLKHKDVIVYDQTKKRWVAMDKSEFLKDVFLDINKLNQRIYQDEENQKKFKENVNTVLEKYHKILQTLTKEN